MKMLCKGAANKMFVLRALMVCVLLTCTLFGCGDILAVCADTEPMRDEDAVGRYIRVGLRYGNDRISSYEINFPRGIVMCKVEDWNRGNKVILEENSVLVRVQISLDAGNIKVMAFDPAGNYRDIGEYHPEMNAIFPIEQSGKQTFRIDGKEYRGGVTFNAMSNTLNIIDYLPIEEYLYGVVNGEIGKGSHIEAKKAQAVAARSYVMKKLDSHSKYGFDICASPHCQLYKGYSDEDATVIKAVNETAGEVIRQNGKIVSGSYYKNSGGYTLGSEDIWGGTTGHLKAVKDIYSPIYSWSKTFSFFEIGNKLAQNGTYIGNVNSVMVAERNSTGRVKKLRISGDNGSIELEKEKIRNILGVAAIKSTMFSLNGNSNIDKDIWKRQLGNMENISKNEEGKAFVASKDGVSLLNGEKVIIGADGQKNRANAGTDLFLMSKEQKIRFMDISNSVGVGNSSSKTGININELTNGQDLAMGSEVTFVGLGYGHGAGMPQDSVIYMAKNGWKYRDILNFYYTGVTVE